jgi:hypothetical protein
MKRIIVTATLIAALVCAAYASAGVFVFSVDFSKKKDVSKIDRLIGGKKCSKSWKGKKSLGARVKVGHKSCVFETSVEGDGKQPDHTIVTTAKVLKKTEKKVRRDVYVGAALRANRKSSYELRVFPKGGRFTLLRNGGELAEDKSKAIAPLGKKNKIQLSATGGNIAAKVNGNKLVAFRDNEPEEVRGTKAAIAFGSEARSNKDGYMVFKNVKVLVPNP